MRHQGSVLLILSHYPAKFSSHKPRRKRDSLFLICHVTSCDRGQMVMWHYGWMSLILSHHCAGTMSVFVGNTQLKCNEVNL